MERKDLYHFAKLHLYTARLLSAIEKERYDNQMLDYFIRKQEILNNFDSGVPLINQSTFFSNAYFILVAFWEGMELSNKEKKNIYHMLEERLKKPEYSELKNIITEHGCENALRLLRNALAHTSFDYDMDGNLVFYGERKNQGTDLLFNFQMFGAFVAELMWAYQEIVYPGFDNEKAKVAVDEKLKEEYA